LIISVAGALIWSTDNLVIAATLGTRDVTRYAVTVRLLTLASSLIAAGALAILPSFTALWSRGEIERMRQLVLRAVRLVVAGATFTGITVALFGRSFLRLWAGNAAVAPRGTLFVLVAIFLVRAFAQAFEMIIISISRHRSYAYVIAAEGVLNLVLSLVLVRSLGLMGVALGTLMAQLAGTGWFLPWSGSRAMRISLRDIASDVVKPLGVTIGLTMTIAGGFAVLLRPQSWITLSAAVATTLAVFVATYWRSGADDWERELSRQGFARLAAVSRVAIRRRNS
jgi:O-antigen/teichoic acid export membrane protein